jgi:tRNA(Ile)-lysidine synthase
MVAWEGAKPASGMAAAARLERYRLLASAAQALGTDLIFTGHTADDQAETVLMRQARGAGRGLAGMARATLFRGRTWILRPLLATRRTALRGQLFDHGVSWIEDPTNSDARFERPRIRALMTSNGPDAAEALRGASEAATRRAELGERAGRFIAESCIAPPGGIRLSPNWPQAGEQAADPVTGGGGDSDHDGLDRDAAIYALRILLAVIGDADQLPDRQRTADLWQSLVAGDGNASLSRCLVEPCGETLLLRRDLRGHAGPAPPLRLSPWADFLPCFDLAPARAVAELIGAAAPPAPLLRLPAP